MNKLSLGSRIVAYRTNKGMLQKELAKKVDISPTALNYYEKDKREPNVLTIVKIAKALEITGDELLGIENEKFLSTKANSILNELEQELLSNFQNLNQEGKEKLLEYSNDLTNISKYKISNHADVAN